MTSQHLYARTPWRHWQEYLPFLTSHHVNMELYLSHQSFEQFTYNQVARLHHSLQESNLRCTLHAPTADFNPGSEDPFIQDLTRQSVLQTIQFSRYLKPQHIVFHSGYPVSPDAFERDRWIQTSINFWQSLLPRLTAADTFIALENIHENEPTALRRVIEGVKNRRLRHCFDIGHFTILANVSLEKWFSELGKYCIASHLHDNHGSSDEHLAIGKGLIDFKQVTNLLQRHAPAAVWTLEAHNLDGIKQSYETLQNIKP